MKESIIKKLFRWIYTIIEVYHYHFSIRNKIKEIRRKPKIRVLFVLSDLSLWKTELLYKALVEHPRFEPMIGTAMIASVIASDAIDKYVKLTNYLKGKGYPYKDICITNIKDFAPDITFYQQPYDTFLADSISYKALIEHGSLICDIRYSLHTIAVDRKHKYVIDRNLHDHSWLMFFENELTAKVKKWSILRGKNIVITGVPMQDLLRLDDSSISDPWKEQEKPKKRIIFAPHHTIPSEKGVISFSTFLDVYQIMLDLSQEYKDSVQFAFKPHPFLRKKLVELWGEKKTSNYYDKWATQDNTQLHEGNYTGLFKYSDAMIHDCGSFTVEYCYQQKPVMYLVSKENEDKHKMECNDFAQMAYDLHTHGVLESEIRNFIESVLAEEDEKKALRQEYYSNYLIPPYGKTASENIINAILKQEEYL